MEQSIGCRYCKNKEVKYLFKAHAPEHVMGNPDQTAHNREAAHFYNIFLCSDCAGDAPRGSGRERYGEVRFVKQRPDTLSDAWEKEWQLLYLWNGRYVYLEPGKKIYRIFAHINQEQ